jgi:hypothetical protein
MDVAPFWVGSWHPIRLVTISKLASTETPMNVRCAQQARSNSALPSLASHHLPALRLWWNALLREG